MCFVIFYKSSILYSCTAQWDIMALNKKGKAPVMVISAPVP